jgi:hypothetical protein
MESYSYMVCKIGESLWARNETVTRLLLFSSKNKLYILNLTEPSHTQKTFVKILCILYKDRLQSEKSKTERGSKGPGLSLSAGVRTVFLLEREDLGTSLLLCPGKMFRQGN